MVRARRLACAGMLTLAACAPSEGARVEGGDPDRGQEAIRQYACPACHLIPGITGKAVFVGPRLHNLADRIYIAGVLPNTPENLVAWLRDPPAIDPLTAMPRLGLTERDARDIAAYLYEQE